MKIELKHGTPDNKRTVMAWIRPMASWEKVWWHEAENRWILSRDSVSYRPEEVSCYFDFPEPVDPKKLCDLDLKEGKSFRSVQGNVFEVHKGHLVSKGCVDNYYPLETYEVTNPIWIEEK